MPSPNHDRDDDRLECRTAIKGSAVTSSPTSCVTKEAQGPTVCCNTPTQRPQPLRKPSKTAPDVPLCRLWAVLYRYYCQPAAVRHFVTLSPSIEPIATPAVTVQPSTLRPQRVSEGGPARGILELRGGMQVIRWGAGLVHRHGAGASRFGVMPRVFFMCGWCGLCRGQAQCVWASSSGHVLGSTIEGLWLLLCVCGEVRVCASLCT